MNKYILMAALAAPSFVLMSCSPDEPEDGVAEAQLAAPSSCPKTPESMMDDVSDMQNEVATMLEECNKDNADAKAEKIAKLVGKIKETEEELAKIVKENKEVKEKLFFSDGMKKAMEAKRNLYEAKSKVEAADYYGSSALKTAISGED